jgi:hypothetical protein
MSAKDSAARTLKSSLLVVSIPVFAAIFLSQPFLSIATKYLLLPSNHHIVFLLFVGLQLEETT